MINIFKFSVSVSACIILLSGCAATNKMFDSNDGKAKYTKTDDVKSIEIYTKITKNEPSNKGAWHKLSLIYYDRKMFPDAIKSASTGLKLIGDDSSYEDIKLELQAVVLISSLKVGSKVIQDMNINQPKKDFNTRTEIESMIRVLQKALNDNSEIISDNIAKEEHAIKSDKPKKPKPVNKSIEKPVEKPAKVPNLFNI